MGKSSGNPLSLFEILNLPLVFNSACRYMMSLPIFKQQLYSSVSESSLREAMMNVMQATFVTQQSPDADVQSKGQQFFNTLFPRYFKETVKVSGLQLYRTVL